MFFFSMFILMLIVFGEEIICGDLAAHDKIEIKMTVGMKITIIVKTMFAGSTITWKNIF